MQKVIHLFFSAFLVLILLGFQDSRDPSLQTVKVFSAEELREDLRVMQSAFRNGHPSPARYRTPEQLEKKFQNLHDLVSSGMTAPEFYKLLWSVVAYMGDGHGGIVGHTSLQNKLRTGPVLLPFRPVIRGNRLFVLRNYSSVKMLIPGSEILALDGVPASDVLTEALQYVPADGYILTGKVHRLETRILWLYPLMKGFPDSHTILFRPTARAAPVKTTIRVVSAANLRERVRERHPELLQRRPVYEYEPLPEYAAARLTIRTLAENQERDFSEFLAESFARIRQEGVQHLILDLRNNPGGRSSYGIRLYSYLTDRPFKFYEHRYTKRTSRSLVKYMTESFPSLGKTNNDREKLLSGGIRAGMRVDPVREPAENPFLGKLYILINGGTFSAAAEVAAITRHNHRGVFVGRETAGAFEGNSSGVTPIVRLPNTQVGVVVPLVWYQLAVSSKTRNGRGVIPDYPIERTLGDLLQGKDTQMEIALDLVRQAHADVSRGRSGQVPGQSFH